MNRRRMLFGLLAAPFAPLAAAAAKVLPQEKVQTVTSLQMKFDEGEIASVMHDAMKEGMLDAISEWHRKMEHEIIHGTGQGEPAGILGAKDGEIPLRSDATSSTFRLTMPDGTELLFDGLSPNQTYALQWQSRTLVDASGNVFHPTST